VFYVEAAKPVQLQLPSPLSETGVSWETSVSFIEPGNDLYSSSSGSPAGHSEPFFISPERKTPGADRSRRWMFVRIILPRGPRRWRRRLRKPRRPARRTRA
jgi:hypothetical protein